MRSGSIMMAVAALAMIAAPSQGSLAAADMPRAQREPRVPFLVQGDPADPLQLMRLARKNARARQTKRGKRGKR